MFRKIINSSFVVAAKTLATMVGGRDVLEEGIASGALVSDRELKGDALIGQALLSLFSNDPRFAYIIIEGHKPYPCIKTGSKKGKYVVGIDPFDGSLDYETAYQTSGAPYTLVITIAKYTEGENILFDDVVAAGVYDFRQGDAWYAEVGVGSFVRKTKSGKYLPAQPISAVSVDIGKQIVIAESYYPATRQLANRAFATDKGYLRSIGSAAYEMTMVATGFAAQFCLSQKHHELGATRLIVELAGGTVIDPNTGVSIKTSPWMFWTGTPGNEFDWNFQTAEITACNADYAKALFEKLQPHLQ